jgi:HEAT repeat-containing protein 5
MLASVLILTVIPTSTKVSAAVVEHCCYQITEKLLDLSDVSLYHSSRINTKLYHQISLTAAHCAKTLIITSSSGNALLRLCTKLLMPGLIQYIAKLVPLVNEGSVSDTHASAMGEIWKAWSAFYASVGDAEKTRLLGIYLPTMIMLLSNASSPQGPQGQAAIQLASSQCVGQLLSFASSSPAAFKDATAKLEAPMREVLESSIRRAVGGGSSAGATGASKPQISLRSF